VTPIKGSELTNLKESQKGVRRRKIQPRWEKGGRGCTYNGGRKRNHRGNGVPTLFRLFDTKKSIQLLTATTQRKGRKKQTLLDRGGGNNWGTEKKKSKDILKIQP